MTGKPPSTLDGLIQAKGAPRPSDLPQRGEAVAAPPAAPKPAEAPTSKPIAATEPRTKSLTLRLSEAQYQRLRRFAFDRDASHQDVIEAALIGYLDREGG